MRSAIPALAQTPAPHDYAAVDAIFNQHCLDCHASQDAEGQFVLESFEALMKGGEIGPAVVPGQSGESLLVKMIEGRFEKEGKKMIMPPGKRKKLAPEEIATIKGWIDAGAPAPTAATGPKELVVPRIEPKVAPRNPVNALASSPADGILAIARYAEVELRTAKNFDRLRTLAGHTGNVNALAFSADGAQLFSAAGQPGLFGEVRHWHVGDGKLIQVIQGHKDATYALAISPDGTLLATGSYDQKIKLWNVASGQEIRTLSGHNGCVRDLAFRPDGKILASASADRTVKLWDVATGERRETLSQPIKEVYSVAFSADGQRLFAGGADNRIRIWEISENAAETSNPLLVSKFAHEGAILKLVFSSDGKLLLSSGEDRTVRLWDAVELKERVLLEKQPDWAPALAFVAGDTVAAVGRLDGSVGFYDVATGAPALVENETKRKEASQATTAKPEIVQLEPRGIQRGTTTKIKLLGTNLTGLTGLTLSTPKLTGELLGQPSPTTNEAWIEITAAADLSRDAYEIAVRNSQQESGKVKLYVDDLPQAYEAELKQSPSGKLTLKLPGTFWGLLERPGDADEIEFEAKAGHSLVFDLAAKNIGSKVSATLALFDEKGGLVASDNGFDGGDPLLHFKIPSSGRYRLRIADQTGAGSKDHFYRLTAGAFPYVVGFFPLSVAANRETEVELIGFNLPAKHAARIDAAERGETLVPLEANKFRSRRPFKVLVSDGVELLEAEPNDAPSQAMPIPFPSTVGGRLWPAAKARTADADLFRFEAKGGQTWAIETEAARRNSPVDTRIEILHPDGRPVERLLLQAVRDSHITFRPIDSGTDDARVVNWQEMELGQFMYLQGEVCRIFRMPQGPDSGFQFFNVANKRRCYFGTSPTAHALDEAAYIIEPHPPGSKLVANGLPVFTVHYANDDDGERKLGTDSRVLFTAPTDGAYLIRVTDTRGHGGQRFAYRLIGREASPDFKVTLGGGTPSLGPGGGQEFTLTADRIDGFDGDISIEIDNLPEGYTCSTPMVIQAGHLVAAGTLNAATDAPETKEHKIRITARGEIHGSRVSKEVKTFGRITQAEHPKLFVALESYDEAATNFVERSVTEPPLEITIAPGQTIPAWLKVRRAGHDDLITFAVNNLPHGIIVDNIGLNGVLIPKGESERQIFFSAAKWVPETDRLVHAQAKEAGKPTSLPVWLRVKKAGHPVAKSK